MSRSIIRVLSFGILLFLAGCGKHDDSILRGNLKRTGETDRVGPNKITRLVKEIKVPGFVCESPVVSGSTVFLSIEESGRFLALDAQTGEFKWESKAKFVASSEPVTSDGLIYITTEDDVLYAIDMHTGQLKWEFSDTCSKVQPVAVSEDLLLFGDSDYFYALDKNTGEKKWIYGAKTKTAPSVSEGVVYFSDDTSFIYALEIKTGREVAKYNIRELEIIDPKNSFLPIYKKELLFSSSYSICAVNLKTGAMRYIYRVPEEKRQFGSWRWKINSEVTPSVSEGVVYFSMGIDDITLYAISIKTGEIIWEKGYEEPTTPIISKNKIYLGTENSRLYALDKKTGDKIWEYNSKGHIRVEPAIMSEKIYLTDTDSYSQDRVYIIE